MILSLINAVFECRWNYLFPPPPINYRDWILDLNGEKTDFKIESFENEEEWIFEIYWLCKRHPQWNTASIKPKITILLKMTSSIWKSVTKFCFLFTFKMVLELFFPIFFHFWTWWCRSSGHLSLDVHDFCLHIMSVPQTRPEVCSDFDFFVALKMKNRQL